MITPPTFRAAVVATCFIVTQSVLVGQRQNASEAKPVTIPLLLSQLQSTNDSTRARAFYALLRGSRATISTNARIATKQLLIEHPQSAERIRVALIELLSKENSRIFSNSPPTFSEWYGGYHGDLIVSVATLKDGRAANALLSAVSTGGAAVDGIASLGEPVLSKVVALHSSPKWEDRMGAASILGAMSERRSDLSLSDAAIATIRTELLRLTTDTTLHVRQISVRGLRSFDDDEVRARIEVLAQDSSDCSVRFGSRACPVKDEAGRWLAAHKRP